MKDITRKEPRLELNTTSLIFAYYKMICPSDSAFQCDDVFRGEIKNISRGGLLLVGSIPGASWHSVLLSGDVKIGFNIKTPDDDLIKVLGRVKWAQLERPPRFYKLGVEFTKIDASNQEKLNKILIRTELEQRKQPETRRIRRREDLLLHPNFVRGNNQ